MDWDGLVREYIRRYPAMKARDVYKLLYQGVRGPEHVMPSAQAFSAYLQQEIAGLQPDPCEPLWESIRPDGSLGRIHLRPWLAGTADLDRLIEASLETGRRAWGSAAELRRVWQTVYAQALNSGFPFLNSDELRAFHALLAEQDFPAMHHSDAYRAAYQPAYRLLAADLINQLV